MTSAIVEWLPVFTTAPYCDILIDSLEYCRRQKALEIYGWVILDNHFHAILRAPDLSSTLRDFKSFTAMRIIQQLELDRREWLLKLFRYHRGAGKPNEYQVWQEGFFPKAICSDEIMIQKLNYLHHNPVKRGWVASPEHWRYSSAHEWLEGSEPRLRCDCWV